MAYRRGWPLRRKVGFIVRGGAELQLLELGKEDSATETMSLQVKVSRHEQFGPGVEALRVEEWCAVEASDWSLELMEFSWTLSGPYR